MRYVKISRKRSPALPLTLFFILFSTISYQIIEPVSAEENANKDTPLVIKDITFKLEQDGREIVFIQGNRFFEPTVFSIDGEKPRVVIDIKNLNRFKKGPSRIAANGKLIKQIRIHYHKAQKKLRVVLDHDPSFNYTVNQVFFQADNIYAVVVERQ